MPYPPSPLFFIQKKKKLRAVVLRDLLCFVFFPLHLSLALSLLPLQNSNKIKDFSPSFYAFANLSPCRQPDTRPSHTHVPGILHKAQSKQTNKQIPLEDEDALDHRVSTARVCRVCRRELLPAVPHLPAWVCGDDDTVHTGGAAERDLHDSVCVLHHHHVQAEGHVLRVWPRLLRWDCEHPVRGRTCVPGQP